MWIIWVILIAVAVFAGWAIFNQVKVKTKCESCGKYFALNILNKQEMSRRQTTKTVRETERYRYGNTGEWRTRQVERQVPAEAVQYQVESVCKYCGQHKSYITEEVK